MFEVKINSIKYFDQPYIQVNVHHNGQWVNSMFDAKMINRLSKSCLNSFLKSLNDTIEVCVNEVQKVSGAYTGE